MQGYENFLKGFTFRRYLRLSRVGWIIKIPEAPKARFGFSHSFPFFNFYFAGSLAFFLNFAPENKLLSI